MHGIGCKNIDFFNIINFLSKTLKGYKSQVVFDYKFVLIIKLQANLHKTIGIYIFKRHLI